MDSYEEIDLEVAMFGRASQIAAELAQQEDDAGTDLTVPPGAAVEASLQDVGEVGPKARREDPSRDVEDRHEAPEPRDARGLGEGRGAR